MNSRLALLALFPNKQYQGSIHLRRRVMRCFLRSGFRFSLVALVTLLPLHVYAAGFALLEQSSSRLGTAFAGTAATADDASTIFYNPAGLAKLTETQFLVVGSGVLIKSEFNNRNS